MPISYLSKVINPSVYVLPIDLGLMTKVGMYKEGQFTQNAEKLNAQFAQAYSQSIANPYQKQHFDDVMTNLSSQVADMGGMDYSDANVSNTLGSYVNSVYTDPIVLQGILSTKGINAYNANTDALKSNPKTAKLYDPAINWYEKDNPDNPNSQYNYMHGDINATYNGPTSPTLSIGNDWDLAVKDIQKLHPDITTRIDPVTNNKYFVNITTGQQLSPEAIRTLIDGHIDGPLANQMMMHAAYNYSGLTGGTYSKADGIAEFNNMNKLRLAQNSDYIDALKNKLIDPVNTTREETQKQLDEAVASRQNILDAVVNGAAQFGSQWDKNKNSALYMLYKNKITNDAVNVYGRQTIVSSKYVPNLEQIALDKIQLEAAKLGAKIILDAGGGYHFEKISGSGSTTYLNSPYLPDKTTEDKLNEQANVSTTTYRAAINDEHTKDNSDLKNIIYETARLENIPGIIGEDVKINSDPNVDPAARSSLLNKISVLSGDPTKLEPEDISRIISGVRDAGNFDENGNFVFKNKAINKIAIDEQNTGKTVGYLNAKDITFFKKVNDVFNAGSNGKNINGLISNSDAWKSYFERHGISQNIIAGKEQILNSARQSAADEIAARANLNPAETIELKKYLDNPSEYTHTSSDNIDRYMKAGLSGDKDFRTASTMPSVTVSSNNKVFNSMIKRISTTTNGLRDIDNIVDNKLKSLENRNVYHGFNIFADEDKELNKQYINIKNYLITSEDPSKLTSVVGKKEDVDIRGIIPNGDKYYLQYGNKNDLSKSGLFEIDESNLRNFGIEVSPYAKASEVVDFNGHLAQPLWVDPVATGNSFNKNNNFTASVKIDVYKFNPGGQRNTAYYLPAIIYNGRPHYFRGGRELDPASALERLKQLIQSNSSVPSLDVLIANLDANIANH